MSFVLQNTSLYQVRIPYDIATKLFAILSIADDMAKIVHSEDDEDSDDSIDAYANRNNTEEHGEEKQQETMHVLSDGNSLNKGVINIRNTDDNSNKSDNRSGNSITVVDTNHEQQQQQQLLMETMCTSDNAVTGTKRQTGDDPYGDYCLGNKEADALSELSARNLDYSDDTLDALAWYACLPDEQRTESIPAPLTTALCDLVYKHEMEMLCRAEDQGYLAHLLDAASFLKFEQLMQLCCAYCSERIVEISKAAPTIMEGASRIRELLCLENTWTAEEMEHLRLEMEHVKSVCPNAY